MLQIPLLAFFNFSSIPKTKTSVLNVTFTIHPYKNKPKSSRRRHHYIYTRGHLNFNTYIKSLHDAIH